MNLPLGAVSGILGSFSKPGPSKFETLEMTFDSVVEPGILDGDSEQGISADQYQKIAKVSKATATGHLADMVTKGCLEKLPGGGRSTRYRVKGM